MELLPYHDPRVTRRNALLRAYASPPRVIFTGDSRTKNGIVPEVVARTLGVPHQTLFNFGTGSQVARFAREAFLPHLRDMEILPEFLVFGVSPDWPLEKRRLWELIDRYRESLAYRLEHAPASGGDAVEGFVTRFLSYRLSLYRYRRDLVEQELLPDLRCWFLDDCTRDASDPRATPVHFKDLERRSGFKTAAGWGPNPMTATCRESSSSAPVSMKRLPWTRRTWQGCSKRAAATGSRRFSSSCRSTTPSAGSTIRSCPGTWPGWRNWRPGRRWASSVRSATIAIPGFSWMDITSPIGAPSTSAPTWLGICPLI